MEKEEEKFDLSAMLKRTFFGVIPKTYQQFPKDTVERTLEVIKRQGSKSATDINYVALIQDMGESFFGTISKLANQKESISPEEIRHTQYLNHVLLSSLYNNVMQNKDEFSPYYKIQLAQFYRNLLLTATSLYKIDLIIDQNEFIKQTKLDEAKFQEMQNEIDELIAAILKPEVTNEYWCHTYPELVSLSEELFNLKYIHSAESFSEQFCDEPEQQCNWLGNLTSLMFLFQLLFNEREKLPTKYFAFVSERFTRGGNKIDERTAESTSSKIKAKTDINADSLDGQFFELSKAYRLVFLSK